MEKGDYETILYFFVLRKVFRYIKEKKKLLYPYNIKNEFFVMGFNFFLLLVLLVTFNTYEL